MDRKLAIDGGSVSGSALASAKRFEVLVNVVPGNAAAALRN
jgi:hypothetical protein